MKKYLLGITLFSVIFFAGCGTKTPSTTCTLTGSNACAVTTGTVSDVHDVAQQVLLALKDNDMQGLSTFVGAQGVRFSPYGHVNLATDVVLSAQEIAAGPSMNRSFNRGAYDGSGLPIDLGFGQYFQKFVYDADFLSAPEKYENQKFDRGTLINNIFDVYTGKQIFEYYFSGFDAQYAGMDWKSLILVLDLENNEWKLIGIIHNQWTT